MDFDVIIIGGGLGGLSAGAILARHGNKVILLEQHNIPGGCATTFKRKDFLMEAGLHAMDGHLIDERKNHSILRFLGVKKSLEFQTLPEFFHIRNSRIDFTFPNGYEQAVKALIKAYPLEEKGIRKFFNLIMGVQDELSRFPKNNWEKALKYSLFPLLYPRILKTFSRTLGYFLDRYFKSEEIKLILQGNLLYYHDDPYSMSMIFFAKAQASFIHHGGYYIKGGSQQLSDSLAGVIRKNQGDILLGKRVDLIMVENRKAVGVKFRDVFNSSLEQEIIRAPHVIHSGAVPLAVELLKGDARKRIRKKIAGMTPSCSLFCIYIGFSRELKSLGNKHYSNFIYGDDVTSLKEVHNNYYGPWDQRSFVFVDYSQIDSGLTPQGKSFGVICTADRLSDWEGLNEPDYKGRKEEVARILLDRLESVIPGVKGLIETYEIGTSRTIKRYTLNPHGAPYGFAQTPLQAGFKRPSYKSSVPGLWFSGTGTFPGGGFTGAIVSGFLCGLQVKKRLEKRKQFTKRESYADQRIVQLVRKEVVATRTLELSFKKPEGFRHTPGQYAWLSLQEPAYTDLDMPLRALSIASHPDEELLKFVFRISNSSFKKSCEALQSGDRATIYGPVGEFTLVNSVKGVAFLVSGIGISPVISMLRDLELQKYQGPVYLFYSNKTESSAAYHHQLNNPGLKNYGYVPVFTGKEDRISAATLKKELDNLMELDYYIVGSSGFLDSMVKILHENNIAEKQIHLDDFG